MPRQRHGFFHGRSHDRADRVHQRSAKQRVLVRRGDPSPPQHDADGDPTRDDREG
jgi:hypothetical protein